MSDQSNKKYGPLMWLLLGVFIIGGAWFYYERFWKNPITIGNTPDSNMANDPLCESVKAQQLQCVVGLASENVLGPGHFVAYSSNSNADTKVPFPDGDLFRKYCLVPGEQHDR